MKIVRLAAMLVALSTLVIACKKGDPGPVGPNTLLPGGRLMNMPANLDPRDYYAMCNYYNLPY